MKNQDIVNEVLRWICDESMSKINKCLDLLTDKEVNYRPNEHSNSVAILIFHLNGNVRQWILSGVCGQNDVRNRDAEFNLDNHQSIFTLRQILDHLKVDLQNQLPAIIDSDLMEKKKVQCYNESKLSMLFHATEHFSYHTGQIAQLTKLIKDVDTGFYAGQDLNA